MTAIVLENVIISFPHLFEPKQYEGQGAFRYSGNFIFPQNYDFTALLALIAAARVEKGLPETSKTPLSQVKDGPYKGQWTLAAYAYEYAPQVVDQAVQPIMDKKLIWAGCRVNANVDIYGHNKAGGGVTAGLTHVMIVDNVESAALPRLDNRKDAADVFQPIQGAPVASAPAGGAAPTGVPQGVIQPQGLPNTAASIAAGGVPQGGPGQPSMAGGVPQNTGAPMQHPVTNQPAMPGQEATQPGQPQLPGQPSFMG